MKSNKISSHNYNKNFTNLCMGNKIANGIMTHKMWQKSRKSKAQN